jgi:hypothetical protein
MPDHIVVASRHLVQHTEDEAVRWQLPPLTYAINGCALEAISFAELASKIFDNVTSIAFDFDAEGKGDQYYIAGATAIAAVPVPASGLLLAAALGGLGLARRRKRTA